MHNVLAKTAVLRLSQPFYQLRVATGFRIVKLVQLTATDASVFYRAWNRPQQRFMYSQIGLSNDTALADAASRPIADPDSVYDRPARDACSRGPRAETSGVFDNDPPSGGPSHQPVGRSIYAGINLGNGAQAPVAASRSQLEATDCRCVTLGVSGRSGARSSAGERTAR